MNNKGFIYFFKSINGLHSLFKSVIREKIDKIGRSKIERLNQAKRNETEVKIITPRVVEKNKSSKEFNSKFNLLEKNLPGR